MSKLKIKALLKNEKCKLEVHGDWIDMSANGNYTFKAPTLNPNDNTVSFDFKLIKLGNALKLPKGFEAMLLPRSGLFKKKYLTQANSEGVIDNNYSGNNDEYMFPAIAFNKCEIKDGDRICQIRIQPSQHCSVLTKLKWIFTSGVEIEYVDSLDDIDRGGFGNSGGL